MALADGEVELGTREIYSLVKVFLQMIFFCGNL